MTLYEKIQFFVMFCAFMTECETCKCPTRQYFKYTDLDLMFSKIMRMLYWPAWRRAAFQMDKKLSLCILCKQFEHEPVEHFFQIQRLEDRNYCTNKYFVADDIVLAFSMCKQFTNDFWYPPPVNHKWFVPKIHVRPYRILQSIVLNKDHI